MQYPLFRLKPVASYCQSITLLHTILVCKPIVADAHPFFKMGTVVISKNLSNSVTRKNDLFLPEMIKQKEAIFQIVFVPVNRFLTWR